MAELERLSLRLLRAKTALTRIALDDQWRLALVAHRPNRVLVGIIENMMLRTRRYELAWMRRDGAAEKAGDTHSVIMRALRARRVKDACAALRQNLTEANRSSRPGLRRAPSVKGKRRPVVRPIGPAARRALPQGSTVQYVLPITSTQNRFPRASCSVPPTRQCMASILSNATSKASPLYADTGNVSAVSVIAPSW
jgi:hypothetical protein